MVNSGKYLAVFGCMLLLQGACTHSFPKTEIAETIEIAEEQRPLLTNEALKLNLDSLSEMESMISEDHLFGKFFNDRAEYFVVENPSNTIFQTNVHSITLFHLDGKLGQTKYVLEEDIASNLLQQFGACKIVGLDSLSKMVMESESIVLKKEGKLVLNPKLTAYELRWVLDDKEVRYRVRENETKDNFVFIERLKSYQKEVAEIERTAVF